MANADVFDIIPEVPVTEGWQFETDVLVAHDGSQTRIALLENPRVSLDMRIRAMNFDDRRSLFHTLTQGILTAYSVPQFQYAAPLTATAAAGQPRVYFNPALTNIRAGQDAVLFNALTGATEKLEVDVVETDGATFTTNLANEQAAGAVFCVPAPRCVIPDGQKLNSSQNSTEAQLTAEPLDTWALERPGASVSLTTFNSLTVLDKPILGKMGESFLYRRELLDNGVGAIEVKSRDEFLRSVRRVEFEASRAAGDLDFWRTFFATVRGGQVSFLLSTQLPDLSLSSAPGSLVTTLNIAQPTYASFLFPNDAFKRVAIEYADGTATSYHVVNSATTTTITLATAIASTSIRKISFLQRVRASDTVRLDHSQDITRVVFDVQTVKN